MRRMAWLLVLAMVVIVIAVPHRDALAAAPDGVWLIDDRAAVEVFGCDGSICGRILWLKVPRDAQGELDRDKNNPDPGMKQRRLCGLTVFWGLRLSEQDRWTDGWFYNPDDGETYRVSVEFSATDLLTARIYRGIPLFGETKTLRHVARGSSDGWC
jgi:uncharacterized protein (DUF2147 family)